MIAVPMWRVTRDWQTAIACCPTREAAEAAARLLGGEVERWGPDIAGMRQPRPGLYTPDPWVNG